MTTPKNPQHPQQELQEPQQQPPLHWTRHRVFGYTLVARLVVLVVAVMSTPSDGIHGQLLMRLPFGAGTFQALRSLMAQPAWTIPDVYERMAHQTWDHVIDNVDSSTTRAYSTYVGIASLLLLSIVDYLIAQQFYEIMCDSQTLVDAEQQLITENIMPAAIRPQGLTTPLRGQDGDKEKDDAEEFYVQLVPDISSKSSMIIPLFYFANPCAILATSLFQCYANVKLLCLLAAVNHGCCILYKNKTPMSSTSSMAWLVSLALAVAVYLDVRFAVFAVALVGRGRLAWDKTFLCYSALQILGSTTEAKTFFLPLRPSIIDNYTVPAPSLSVLWYTQMEFFTRFAPYLTLVLTYVPYVVILPLYLRLHRYPVVLVTIYWIVLHMLGQWTFTLTDVCVGLCLMLCEPHSLCRMSPVVSLISLAGMGVPVTLYLVLHPLWLQSTAGEANFLYFQCLAFNVFVANVALQFVSASLQRDKALRISEKLVKEQQQSSDPTGDFDETAESPAVNS